jgi:HKD family nuclease
MMSIVTKLSDELWPKLKSADELWVAVGLINLNGLNFLLDSTRPNCTRSFLLGIDLPTDPEALHKLNELQLKPNLNVRLFTDQEFFHPKMYLLRTNNIFSGFIGSANCTNGGLNRNIELTIPVDDQMICAGLKSWFEARFDQAKRLTNFFVETYRAHYIERR